ncbi:MAG: C10 family peptidase [Bacteroidales bacterium]|nr:C10 family peptidase [Bacteroidales bacterium]
MKKTILTLFVALLTVVAVARPVDANMARRVAETYLNAQGMRNTATLVDITPQTPFTEFYVFAASEGGFILVSADDCVVPVLGYSTTSQFAAKDIPGNVREWLDNYEREIRYYKSLEARRGALTVDGGQPGEVARQWEMLSAGVMPPAPLTTSVSPLLTTTWNQSPYYNNLCPADASGNLSVTGCVATATAQVMKYHNHPTTGYGSHTYTSERTVSGTTYTFSNLTANFGSTTYQWSSMPNELTGSSSSTQVNAVATLMYHIGVADEMKYSPYASGATNYNYFGTLQASSQTSLMQYFKYRPDMAPLCRDDYSDVAYGVLLRAELDQSRPILVSGNNVSAGHSFVFDGYDNYGDIHVNWGWGSYHDGYFTIGSLNPGVGGIGGNSSGTYNMSNVALIGIRPNTNWSTSGSTTISVTSTGNGTVSGGGAYTFGETVSLLATANAGYRFSGWSDGSKFNPRELVANGGSYSFTANFEPITGDTLHFCPGGYNISRYGSSTAGDDKYWGIHLPASLLTAGSSLTAVQFYVGEAGSYNLTVYTGTNHNTVAATASAVYTVDQENSWQTITLSTPVAATSDIWLIYHNTDAYYPASFTYYGGTSGGMVWGTGFDDNGSYWHGTFMIRGIFSTPATGSGDTVSYCGNAEPQGAGVGTGGGSLNWGIMLPPSNMTGNYLKSVMLYVLPGQTGSYTLNVYRGGDTVPGTLAHSQVVNFDYGDTLWQEVQLDATFALNSQNLWITFATSGLTYPMAVCNYAGSPNSDWLSLNGGSTWAHCGDYDLNYSWLIKAITSATLPILPPPTVIVSGQYQLATNQAYEFNATGTDGATITWSLPGATPSTATGSNVFAQWSTPGYYNVIATISNAYGSSVDTMEVLVIDYTVGDTVSYCLDRPFYGLIGTGDSGAISWGIMLPSAFLANRHQITGIMAGLNELGAYSVRIYQGGTTAPGTLIHTGNFVVTSIDTTQDYYTYVPTSPIAINSNSNLWVVIHTEGLGYPAKRCWHTTDANSDWISLDDENWYHLPDYNRNYSWMIKVITGSTTSPVQYTVTATSNDATMGSVTGSGSYNAGDTAILTAVPNSGYQFTYWDDGVFENPRSVQVDDDLSFTAFFTTQRPIATGDTISHCGNDAYYTSMGAGGNIYWGIMLPAANLTGRNYLKSVMLYVSGAGTYTMSVYRGGDTVPGTLAHTQNAIFDADHLGWQEIQLDATCAINNQNLWITFHNNDINYPASSCYYVGGSGSDWVSTDGSNWFRLAYDFGFNVSWLIKAVTSVTQPVLPAPTVHINGPVVVATGQMATFTAMATAGTTVSWTLTGATPATATGDTVSAVWSAPGTYNVIATVTNSYGTGSDTLQVQVITCNMVTSYPFTMGFSTAEQSNLNCWTVLDADGDGYSWMLGGPGISGYMGSASYINGVGPLSPDNWLITPQMQFTAGNTYHLNWSISALDDDYAAEHYGVYVSTTGTATSNFTLIQEYTLSSATEISMSLDLSTYAGQNVYIAFRHWNCYDQYWLLLDSVAVTENSSSATYYTVTATSDNSSMGTVTGGGSYPAGSTATLTAIPYSGFVFTQWNDGVTTNPRSIVVNSNINLVAYFDVAPTSGDTISYCGDAAIVSSIGTNGGDMYWGIMLTPAQLTGHNYLKSVMLLYLASYPGDYTLNIYNGGTNSPGTLVHSQTFTISDTLSGWKELLLDATLSIGSQNLWITFHTTGLAYPAACCAYTGDDNSDWASLNGADWSHLYQLGSTLTYSWMIKAVTSNTSPALPAPTVSISGLDQVPVDATVTFTATGTSGAVITWNLQGASPAVATGSTATTTWHTAGVFNVVATVSNANGTSRDTLRVRVVDYNEGDTVSYCLDRDFATAIGTGDTGALSWGIMLPAAYLQNRDKIEQVLLYTADAGTYTLRVYQGGDTVPQTLVATQVFTITDTSAGYKTLVPAAPITIDKTQNLWVTFHTDDIAYPALACAHMGDGNSDWLSLDDTNWYHMPQYRLNFSWMLKVVTSALPPTYYTVTVIPIMEDGSDVDLTDMVSGAGTYAEGTTVTLTGTFQEGDVSLIFWITATGDTIYSNPYTFVIHSDVNLIAVFTPYGGIGDVNTVNIKLYPNPASDIVVLEGVEGKTEVTVTDLVGRVVLKQAVSEGRNVIDISALSVGTYFVRVANSVRKLVVE